MNQIFKAISEGVENALNIISSDEIHQDIKELDNVPTMSTKKAMAAKYGIESKKAGEIMTKMYERLRDLRNQRQGDFTEEDLRDYSRLFKDGEPTRYNNAKEMYDKECGPFLEYLRDKRAESVMKIAMASRNSMIKSAKTANDVVKLFKAIPVRDLNYTFSFSGIYTIQKYININKYLEENTDNFKNAKQKAESNTDLINSKFTKEMADFKAARLEEVRQNAKSYYNNIPNSIDLLEHEIDKNTAIIIKLFNQWCQENNVVAYNGCLPDFHENWVIRQEFLNRSLAANNLEKEIPVKKNIVKSLKAIINTYSMNEYVEKEYEYAKIEFETKIKEISKRLSDKGIDGATVEIEEVYSDPKCFEMFVHDDNIRLYARSIWAAEYSEKVTPHLRFIITNRPKK